MLSLKRAIVTLSPSWKGKSNSRPSSSMSNTSEPWNAHANNRATRPRRAPTRGPTCVRRTTASARQRRMNRDRMTRFAAVLVGAAVLFGLEQQFGVKLYLAIPAGIAAYFATLIVLALTFGSGNQTK